MSEMVSNCVNIVSVFKTSVGSINSSFSEDNITIVKKITLPSGRELPYISGQAMRYYIRDKWREMGWPISPVKQTKTAIGRAASSAWDPYEYIDDDLFGFLLAAGNGKKRTSPVRVSPAIGFFPFQDDRDLGVRITEEGKKDPTKMMPPFETEIYYNYFHSSILVELDRIGVFEEDYYGKDKAPQNLPKENKDNPQKSKVGRIEALINAIHDLWGGGKQARYLTDISPKLVMYTRQTAKKPIFLERLEMDAEDEKVREECITKTLEDESHIVEKVIIGTAEGFGGFSVGKTLKYKGRDGAENSITVLSLRDAFENMLKDVNSNIP
ncbi:MAG: type I-B CRISPR-associated protein Cas7/Cst2/DevR [Methanobacteriota archaeon]